MTATETIPPHGGTLVDLLLEGNEAERVARPRQLQLFDPGVIRGAVATRGAPLVHAPPAAGRVDADQQHRERQQPQGDPDHLPGSGLPLETEPDQVEPGCCG